MSLTKIPFADLHRQYLSIKDEIDAAIADVIAASAFVRGPHVEAFEASYAAMAKAQHCISCANGTDALYIAMHALGVKPGDEVLVPAQSWISTSETVGQHGAKAIFVDIDEDTHTINPALLDEKITNRTVGIIPVHLYGQAADMDPIMACAKRRGLWVIEDCAQAHLAGYKGQQVGTFGDAATWSFYPGKNLGAMGDAGAITTDDDQLARRMARFARHGGIVKGEHEIEGINSRLDGLQAAILAVKLPHLEHWTQDRRRVAALYDSALARIGGVVVPITAPRREHVYHLYVVQHEDRDALRRHLADDGIATVINYPCALPFLPAYSDRDHRPEDFPVAYHRQSRILSLPIYPEMTGEMVDHVANSIAGFA